MLKYEDFDWGPPPFRFQNCWLDHKGLVDLVKLSWQEPCTTKWKAFQIASKLKRLKGVLKGWNKEVFGEVNLKLRQLKENMESLEKQADEGNLLTDYGRKMSDLEAELRVLSTTKHRIAHQKARLKWIKEGDANTKFFHARINCRRARNKIVTIKVNNSWVKGVLNVRQAITSFFQNHFASSNWPRPTLDGIVFPLVSQQNNQRLVAQFSLEELDAVERESDGNKSPGPDGFNFNFLKAF
jgi:hypothetical protein